MSKRFDFSKIIKIIIIPLLAYTIMEICCRAVGTKLFADESSVQLFFRGLATVAALSFGVSINMHSGRFDFSTGAVMLIGSVIGAKVAYENGLGPIVMVVISAITSTIFGAIVGGLYVLLNLPPMIIGLGCTLVFEGIVAIITDGLKPVRFGADPNYYSFTVSPINMIIILLVAMIIMIIIFRFTKFGYDYRALISGQRIAVNTGAKEKKNAFICYCVAGFMFGISGALSLAGKNGLTPTINFSTIGSMFTCFLPLFFSDFISRYCDKQIAIVLGCVAYEFIQIGFGQISFMRAFFTADVYKVVEAIVLVLFLIYLNNEYKIIEFVTFKKLREKNK